MPNRKITLVLPVVVAVSVFLSDLLLPQHVTVSILYVAAVALSARSSANFSAGIIALCCLGAIIGALVPIPPGIARFDFPPHFVNRGLALFAILTTGMLSNYYWTAMTASKEDQLTQVYNRRGMEAELSLRRHRPTAAILIDIDDFKRINDTWGLLVGDTVLREVAEMLTTVARSEDLVCRYGGDEFLVLLTDVNGQALRKIADRVFRLLSNARIEVNPDGAYVRITASLGVSPLAEGVTIAEAVRQTQGALKRSKGDGKNCVTYLDTNGEVIENVSPEAEPERVVGRATH